MIQIKNVRFVKSAVTPSQYPPADCPEIAFAGRSNTGKSSLINTIVDRKNLVKTSSKPGFTQLINFFTVNDELSFVDLPGFGYAKVSKKIRHTWKKMVESYLSGRPNLLATALLMDIRRGPEQEEFDLIRWFADNRIGYFVVLTKADKLSNNKQNTRLAQTAKMLDMDRHKLILFSAKSKKGKSTVLDTIQTVVEQHAHGK